MFKNSTSRKKLNLIQSFRGLAAILVLLCHANDIFHRELEREFLFNIFGFGWAGVDFFFVLSGFIIFYTHHSDIGKKNSFRSFITKRFIRVYPLYWIILTGKITASLFLSYGGNVRDRSWIEILQAFLLYPQPSDILVNNFIGVSWTLSHEIFFYLAFSLLILLKPKLSISLITIWLFGTLLNFTSVISGFQNVFLLQFIFNERNLEFFLGILAAYLALSHKIKYGNLLIYIAVFLFTLSAINSNYNLIKISPVICYGIPAMLLIMGSVAVELSQAINVPYSYIYIGNSSYSIYLVHGFIISNATKIITKLNSELFTQNPLLLNCYAVGIAITTVFIGCSIYSYIEKPLLSNVRPKLAKV